MPELERGVPRQIESPGRVPEERAGRQAGPEANRGVLLDRANQIFAARRLRPQFFGRAMFGETGWDLLLALYICGQQGGGTSVSSLTRFSGAPQTTVLRWLDYLESRGWVDRDRMQTNRKQANVEITDQARDALEDYLAETTRG